MLCQICEQPLIEMEFAKGFEYVCDNWRCYMYRRPQGCRLKEPQIVAIAQGYQLRHDIGNPARKVFGSGPIDGSTSHSSGCSLAMPSYFVQRYFGWDLGGIHE